MHFSFIYMDYSKKTLSTVRSFDSMYKDTKTYQNKLSVENETLKSHCYILIIESEAMLRDK